MRAAWGMSLAASTVCLAVGGVASSAENGIVTGAGAEVIATPLEPHLEVLPRSESETMRIEAALSVGAALSPFEHLPAGKATNRKPDGKKAFTKAVPTLEGMYELDFLAGRSLFRKIWVGAPSATQASDGLGPLYNERSCMGCHPGNGRGKAPVPGSGKRANALVMKLTGAPDYGNQLQTRSLSGFPAEARLNVSYETETVTLHGGETVTMHKPTYEIKELAYGAFPQGTGTTPRLAPPLIGLGLIEAIRAEDILALEDPDDADGDGISGRARRVASREYDGVMIGRFSRKAEIATVLEQSADAFSHDIGISTHLFPNGWGDCSAAQVDCINERHGDGDVRIFEVSAQSMDLVTLYVSNLAPPGRHDVGDPEVLRGKEMFHAAGCVDCHHPGYVTHRLKDDPTRSFQLIWPYSDFLLHDMGEGLSDNRPVGDVSGREWKTPPLWGIGRTFDVNGQERYLHDGRAHSLLEAVLWHGGEAMQAKANVVSMEPEDRAALIRFLKSL